MGGVSNWKIYVWRIKDIDEGSWNRTAVGNTNVLPEWRHTGRGGCHDTDDGYDLEEFSSLLYALLMRECWSSSAGTVATLAQSKNDTINTKFKTT